MSKVFNFRAQKNEDFILSNQAQSHCLKNNDNSLFLFTIITFRRDTLTSVSKRHRNKAMGIL